MKSLLTCPFGLSSLLSKEIKKLAFPILETKATAVTVETDKKGIYQLNLQSRIANKVYIILGETTVTTFDELFDFITSLPRKEYLFSGNLSVQVVTKTSQLSAERSIQSVAHKAIINALPADKRSPISPVDVFLYLENNHLKVCLNTSGPSLHQRGYKLHTGPAPLKENLAAAMVLLSGWKFKTPLIDPFCGSGTILIEAAMLAKNIAPGAKRTFAFQRFKNYDEPLRNELLNEAAAQTFQGNYQLFGSDSDENVLRYAAENAERAGVADCISFSHKSFGVKWSNEKGDRPSFRILTNPPYGKRLSTEEQLFPLYQQLAVLLSQDGISGGVISSFPELASLLPSQAFSHKTRFNGAEQVQFFWKKPF